MKLKNLLNESIRSGLSDKEIYNLIQKFLEDMEDKYNFELGAVVDWTDNFKTISDTQIKKWVKSLR